MRCLVVDDNNDDRSLTERLLRQCGYRSTAVASGQTALSTLGDQRFDVALVDLDMPGMNGAETLRALRLVDPRMRLLVVSGFDDRAHVLEALSAGADGYLRKDEMPDHLRLALQAISAGKNPLSAGISTAIVRHLVGRESGPVRPPSRPRLRLADRSGELISGKVNLERPPSTPPERPPSTPPERAPSNPPERAPSAPPRIEAAAVPSAGSLTPVIDVVDIDDIEPPDDTDDPNSAA